MVRWNVISRSTVFLTRTHLSAAILAADVSALGNFPVTVQDGAGETAAVMFYVPAFFTVFH